MRPLPVEEAAREVASALKGSEFAVAFTGAGVSTESGIPDFRSPATGLWHKYDPEIFTLRYFLRHPAEFYKVALGRFLPILSAEPNRTHRLLAELERRGLIKGVITQNIDGLHQKAGSENVVELHGHLRSASCIVCGARVPMEEVLRRIDLGFLPPRCHECGGLMKPDVVLFGERLPAEALRRAQAMAVECDFMLVLGSSLVVLPAAEIPRIARLHGAKVAILNRDPTELDHIADILCHAELGQFTAALAEELGISL